jgi:hypothetical protein
MNCRRGATRGAQSALIGRRLRRRLWARRSFDDAFPKQNNLGPHNFARRLQCILSPLPPPTNNRSCGAPPPIRACGTLDGFRPLTRCRSVEHCSIVIESRVAMNQNVQECPRRAHMAVPTVRVAPSSFVCAAARTGMGCVFVVGVRGREITKRNYPPPRAKLSSRPSVSGVPFCRWGGMRACLADLARFGIGGEWARPGSDRGVESSRVGLRTTLV